MKLDFTKLGKNSKKESSTTVEVKKENKKPVPEAMPKVEETVEEEEEVEEAGMSPDDAETNRMYRRISDGKDNPTSSLVNNKVRVVKGGSWKDRAYYLQAGTRRYYDQNKSTSWIGFRCAMDRLGSRVK